MALETVTGRVGRAVRNVSLRGGRRVSGSRVTGWRPLPLALKLTLILSGGLLLGFAVAASGFGGHVDEPLAAAAGCNVNGSGTAEIVIGNGTTTVSVNSASDLIVTIPKGTATQCGTTPLGTANGDINAINFSQATPAPTNATVVIDETTKPVPCGVTVNGTVGAGTTNDALVTIQAFPNDAVTVGAATLDLAGCGMTQGSLTGVGSYTLVASGTSTLSAQGESDDPVSVPVDFVAGQTTAVATETFESAGSDTTVDFSNAYSTCPTGLNTCLLTINSSGAALTSPALADFHAQISGAGGILTTYDFSNGGAGVTTFVGLASGATTFEGQADTYALSGLQGGSQVVAGTGAEMYTVTASNAIFTSGSGADTFQVTGNNNTFQAASGPDTFYDTVPSGTPVNTLDFSQVALTPGEQLAINAAGASESINGNTLPNGSAMVGSSTPPAYTFLNASGSTSASNFTTIKGTLAGSTQFLGGGSGGLTFSGAGSGNSAQFFGNSGVVANLSGGTETTSAQIGPSTQLSNFNLASGQVLVGTPGSATSCAAAASDCDTLLGTASIQSITGAPGGYSTFYAGAGPGLYTFGDPGGNNTFYGGAGPDNFSSAGNNNDFVAGTGTATISESAPVTGASNTLDFSNAFTTCPTGATTCALDINSSGGPITSPSLADLTAEITDSTGTLATYNYSNGGADITNFVGLTSGATNFNGEAGTFTLTGLQSNSNVIAGTGTETYTVTASNTTFTSGAASDTFQVTGNNNTFQAESGPDTFYDTVPTGTPANTLDFSDVLTSSGAPLAINDAGAPESVNGGTLMTGQAALGTPTANPPYTFLNSSSSTSASNFTTIVGAQTGSTQFLAGGTGGLSLQGLGAGNSAAFFGNTGVVANISGAGVITSAQISATKTLSNFNLGSGQVLVAFPGSATSCTSVPADCDTLSGTGSIEGVTGTPTGFSTFYAGPSPGTFNLTGLGGNNTFVGGTGADVFTSTGNNNDFEVGTGDATITDPGSANTVDFSALTSEVTVNVSGQQVVQTPNDAATTPTGLYTFTTAATFVGSPDGSVFDAGTSGETFDGAKSAVNQLSFAFATTSASLKVCVIGVSGCSAGQALLGSVDEQFANINQFDGLSNGATTYVAGNPSSTSYTADATSTPPSVIDYSGASAGVTVNFGAGTVGSDTISGLTDVIGSAQGGNTFIAGSGSETFGDNGTAGGDAINFGNVGTSSNTPLTVNVSGGPSGLLLNDEAMLGTSAVYNFTTRGADFTKLSGALDGNTSFLAGPTGGYGFSAFAGNDTIDFSAATTTTPGVTVNLSSGPGGSVSGFANGKTDSISGLTTVTGSAAGQNKFIGGPGPSTYTFIGNGNGNDFQAGGGTDTFTASGSGNTVDFSQLSSQVTVNVSGQQVFQTPNDSATTTTALYTFTSFGGTAATFMGSPDGSIFYAGPVGDTFDGFNKATNQLSFAFASGSLKVCVVSSTGCSAGEAVLGSVDEQFANINQFDGLSNGATTYVAGNPSSTSYTADATSTPPSVIDYSGASAGVTVNFGAGTVGSDTISGLTDVIGSAQGGNTFIAGSGAETFGDNGTAGGDTINFGNVGTSTTTPLTVNVSGGPAGALLNDEAMLGNSTTYTFTTRGLDFTKLSGALNGNTAFLAGPTGGYGFSAFGSNDTIDFSAATVGVTVNLTGGSSGTVSGFANGKTDSISGLTTVTGSSAGGNTFMAGPGPLAYSFTGNANGNLFEGGSGGSDAFASNGNNNVFQPQAASASINDPGSGNTVDFSKLNSQVTVNVSGFPVSVTPNDSATTATALYTFTSFGSTAATFIGSGAGSIFYAGAAADTFQGEGTSNQLSFASAPGATLQVCDVTSSGCTAGEAVLGSVDEQFSDINAFVSLAGGNTTFVAGTPNGTSFAATGSGNSIDFSAASAGVNVNLISGTTGQVGTDTISGLTTVIGSANGGNTFTAGSASYNFTGNGNGNTFIGGSGTSIFSSTGKNNTFVVGTGPDNIDETGQNNAISFAAVSTSGSTPLTVNVSGTPVNGVSNDTASVGTITYNFSIGGGTFNSFTGAGTGNTDFHAAGAGGGATFSGAGPNNTLDLSANLCGITANMAAGTVVVGFGSACKASGTDTVSGLTTIIGSPSGANVFNADLLGNVFTAASTTNTVSYAGFPSGVCVNLTSDRVGVSCSGGGVVDDFSFPSGVPVIEGSASNDTFQIGTTGATIEGGGGQATIDLSQIPAPTSGTTGATVDLAAGTITAPIPTFGAVSFTPGCGPAAALCVTAVKGSRYDDTFRANSAALGGGLPELSVTGARAMTPSTCPRSACPPPWRCRSPARPWSPRARVPAPRRAQWGSCVSRVRRPASPSPPSPT